MERLERAFFDGETTGVAKRLLGCILVRRIGSKVLSGALVETEAYEGQDDPASHAYRGMTKRNAVMFGDRGHAYVYFSYGNHYCLNVVTRPAGVAGAVLVRALEPLEGVELMKSNRGTNDRLNLTNGPGKLTKALEIDSSLNGEDLTTSERLFLVQGRPPTRIGQSARIGVSHGANLPWRFFVPDSEFVSRRGKSGGLAQNP